MEKEKMGQDILAFTMELFEKAGFETSGEITLDSKIGADLNMNSADTSQLITAIMKKYQSKDFPHQKLYKRGDEFVDFTIRDIADLMSEHLAV